MGLQVERLPDQERHCRKGVWLRGARVPLGPSPTRWPPCQGREEKKTASTRTVAIYSLQRQRCPTPPSSWSPALILPSAIRPFSPHHRAGKASRRTHSEAQDITAGLVTVPIVAHVGMDPCARISEHQELFPATRAFRKRRIGGAALSRLSTRHLVWMGIPTSLHSAPQQAHSHNARRAFFTCGMQIK